MRKFIYLFVFCLSLFMLTGFTYESTTSAQDKAHEIAEIARTIGLSEDDPIITRAQEIWWEEYNNLTAQFNYDRDIIATVIFNEAGYGCSERHMELVAAVVCNRVSDSRFPSTVYGVVTQKGQYHPAYANANSYYGQKARNSDRWALCQEIATRALRGEITCSSNVLYQANFKQGKGVYETHYTSYSTSYFCYG